MDIFQPVSNGQTFSSANGQSIVESLIIRSVDSKFEYDQIWNSKIKDKKLNLDSATSTSFLQARHRSSKLISSRQKKRLDLYSLKGIKYDQVSFMHSIWLSYIGQLLNICSSNSTESVLEERIGQNAKHFQEQLLKADYHGCILKVLQSRNPCFVGLEGMVIRETPNTFVLILEKCSSLKTIPKLNCIFGFDIGKLSFNIYGNQFCNNSSAARTTKKFKSKKALL